MGLILNQLQCGYDASIFELSQLTLAEGEAITIIGQNGSGKSTLLRTICGLIPAIGGEVRIDDVSVQQLDASVRAKKVTMLMQMQSLDLGTTVRELVALGRTPYLGRFGYLSKADWRAVDDAISICDLNALANNPLDKISGGERQRARLAMVLAQQTRIVLLDEPTNHLDVAHRYALYEIVTRIRKERGCVILMVCHSLEDAKRFAQKTLLLHHGATKLFTDNQFDSLKQEIETNTGVPAQWVY